MNTRHPQTKEDLNIGIRFKFDFSASSIYQVTGWKDREVYCALVQDSGILGPELPLLWSIVLNNKTVELL